MSFFFHEPMKTRKVTTGKTKNIKLRDSTKHDMNMHGCKLCTFDKARLKNGKMEPTGPDDSLIYILGEAPGQDEDLAGEQFVGQAGRVIRDAVIDAADDDNADNDVRWNNTIRCHPPGNRNPAVNEIECCRGFIEKDIAKVKPYAIIGTGNIPLKAYAQVDTISNWRGLRIPVKIGGHLCWYCPIFHPSFISRKSRKNKYNGQKEVTEYDLLFQRDINRVLSWLEEGEEPEYRGEWTKKDHLKNCEWVFGEGSSDLRKVEKWLDEMAAEESIGFDWETSCLRPYQEDSRILTLGIASDKKAYAFPCDHPKAWSGSTRKKIMEMVTEFTVYSGTKIAHNLEFELEWAAYFLGDGDKVLWDTNWSDTYAYSFAMDGRKGIHSLDDLCYRNFGFWLKNFSNVNRKNMLAEPLEKVLPYNALDAKYTYLLKDKLVEQIRKPVNKGLEDVALQLIRTSSSIVNTQMEGVVPDWNAYKKFKEEFAQSRKRLEAAIFKLSEVKEYENKFGKFNPGSNDHVKKMLKDILDRREGYPLYKDGKYDYKGKYKVDEKVLSSIPKKATKLPGLILELRQANKLDATYCGILENNVLPDGRIRAQYKTKWVSTLRTACEDPNMQNWPKKRRKDLRSMICAPDGYWLYCCDYGAIQGRAIAMMSEDDGFCDALWHKLDVHGRWAQNLYDMYPKSEDIMLREYDKKGGDMTKEERFSVLRDGVKNRLVFPLFFGATGHSVSNHLKVPTKIGIKITSWFWKTYPGVKEWQERLKEFYNENGYVKSLGGSRRNEPMGITEIINSPIQGVERDIVLDAWNRTTEAGYNSSLEVHDDLSFYLPKGRKGERMVEDIAKIMCLPDYDWVNVPLIVEVTRGPNWYDQEDFGEYSSEDYGHTKNNSTGDLQ